MSAHYLSPRCQAEDMEEQLIYHRRGVCGVRMTPMGERDPSYGPNWKPGHWIFKCPRCSAIRVLDAANLDRYCERA